MRQKYLCDSPNSMPTSTGNTNQNPLSTISITTILNQTSQHSHKQTVKILIIAYCICWMELAMIKTNNLLAKICIL